MPIDAAHLAKKFQLFVKGHWLNHQATVLTRVATLAAIYARRISSNVASCGGLFGLSGNSLSLRFNSSPTSASSTLLALASFSYHWSEQSETLNNHTLVELS